MAELRRVVVTGMGIVSCIGNSQEEVLGSLKAGKSGISFAPEYAEMGFRSHVHGKPVINLEEKIDRKLLRFMGDGAAYNHLAMEQAIASAIRSSLSPRFVPDHLIEAPGIPHTLSGKKQELPIKRLFAGWPVTKVISADATATPEVLPWYIDRAQRWNGAGDRM